MNYNYCTIKIFVYFRKVNLIEIIISDAVSDASTILLFTFLSIDRIIDCDSNQYRVCWRWKINTTG